MLKLIDLFDIETGKDLVYSSLEEGEYNVVGQSATNNSVVGTTQELEDYKLYKANSCITLAHIGNFYATVQPKDFYLGTRVKALIPKFKMSKTMLLLYASFVNLNSYRFSYGRVGGNRIEDLEIPDLLETITIISSYGLAGRNNSDMSRAEQSRAEQKYSVWLEEGASMVKLGTLFQVEKGRSQFDEFIEDKNSNIAYVTTSGVNNGVKCKVLENEHYTLYPEGTITVAMQGTVLASFLQTNPFYLQTHVAALIPKIKMSEDLKLFYCYAIRYNAEKFSFGRKANSHIEYLEIPDLLEAQAFLRGIKKDISKQEEIPYGDNYAVVEYLKGIGITMVKLEKLFVIDKTNTLELNKLEEIKKGIPFVSRTSKNNGISAYVNELEGIRKKPGGTISVAMGGTVMESFLQDEPYYIGRDIAVLNPKVDMTKEEMLFYCLCLKANKYKYSYGRQANTTLADLEVPALDELPKWMEEECEILKKYEEMNVKESAVEKEISLYERSPEDYKGMVLETSNWQKYEITSLFEVDNGKGTLQDKSETGVVPIISSSKENNGVSGYVDVANFEEGKLTIAKNGSVGEVFFQYTPFSATSDVLVLTKKQGNLNPFEAMFFCTIFRQEQFKYNYGRKLNRDRLDEVVIKLPSKIVNGKWEPDYEFMESYIKTLAYSGCLKTELCKLLAQFGEILQFGEISRVRAWDKFKYAEIFTMQIGKSIDLNKLEEDKQGINYVGRTEENNGITSRVKQVDQEAYTGSCITVPMVGNALKSTYQTEPFYTSQNILILRSDRLNKYTAQFFNSIIRQDMYRFTYGRTLSLDRFNDLDAMLPSITLENGKVIPDYVFMEQYVKTLKYSKVL